MSHLLTPRALIGLPVDALWAPWAPHEVEQLNRHQRDAHAYTCPRCGTDLFATVDGWICARKGCSYRQEWAQWSARRGQ